LLGQLAHVIIGAEKSHTRLSVSWRLWDVGLMVPSKSKGLKTKAADSVILSSSLKVGLPEGGGALTALRTTERQRQKPEITFSFPFSST
jgi:hypothetical protein